MFAKRFFYAILAGLLATNVRPSQKWANLKNSNDNDAGHFGVLVFLIVYILIIELFSKSDRTKAGRYNARARSLQKLSLRRRHEFLSSRGIVKAKMVQVRRNLRLRPSNASLHFRPHYRRLSLPTSMHRRPAIPTLSVA